MAPTPQPYRAKDGTISWHVRYRISTSRNPVKDTFTHGRDVDPDGELAHADAAQFARLIDKVGGDAARAIRRRGDTSTRDVPTLRTWFERYQAHTASAHVTPGTLADDKRMAERTWLTDLGNLPLDTIRRADVTAWVGRQRATETRVSRLRRAKALKAREDDPDVVIPEPEYYAPKSISNAQRLLSTVLAAAVEAGHINANPARGVDLPSDAETREMTFLTHNEFTLLLSAVAEYYRPLVAFLAGTGARWGEVTALTWGDIDLDSTTPSVRISRAWKKGESAPYLGTTKTRRGRRTVTLPASVVELLRPLRGAWDERVFTTVQGKRLQSQHFHDRVWSRAITRSQIGKRPRVHDLRHSHASWLIAARVDFKVIQYRLGHESIKTTIDRYGHLSPDAHVGAAEAADIAMSGGLPQIEA